MVAISQTARPSNQTHDVFMNVPPVNDSTTTVGKTTVTAVVLMLSMAAVQVIPLWQEQMARLEDDLDHQGPPSIFLSKSTCLDTVLSFSAARHRIHSCIHTQFSSRSWNTALEAFSLRCMSRYCHITLFSFTLCFLLSFETVAVWRDRLVLSHHS